MQVARPCIGLDPRRFGRGRTWRLSASEPQSTATDDLRLFATTFGAGFVFVSLFLA